MDKRTTRQRNKAHSLIQKENSEKMRQLLEERERTLEEQEKLNERRKLLDSSFQLQNDTTVCDVETLIEHTRQRLSHDWSNHWKKRELFENAERLRAQPYMGEFGIHTYQHWQLPHYHMVRDLLSQLTQQILDAYTHPDYSSSTLTSASLSTLHAVSRDKTRLKQCVAENRTVELLAEEIILQMTSEESHALCSQVLAVCGLARQSATSLITSAVQTAVTEEAPYSRVSQSSNQTDIRGVYREEQRDRDIKRTLIWTHPEINKR